jgi:hypothetical protein
VTLDVAASFQLADWKPARTRPSAEIDRNREQEIGKLEARRHDEVEP